jgi:hypothetical protein
MSDPAELLALYAVAWVTVYYLALFYILFYYVFMLILDKLIKEY